MKIIPLILLTIAAFSLQAKELNQQAIIACSLIKNDTKRLTCYDQAVASEHENTKKASVAPAKKANLQTSNQKQQNTDNFGIEHKKRDSSTESITAYVVKIDKKPHGKLIMHLDNGHTWHQIGSERFTVKVGEQVKIARGFLNSFTMKVVGRNKGIKVKRK